MLNGFYNTDKKFIVDENLKLFNIVVCGTCHGQLVEGYNRLNTYYHNIYMAKKNTKKIEDTPKYKLKSQYVGAEYVNGKTAIRLADVPQEQIEIFFNDLQIAEYFEAI